MDRDIRNNKIKIIFGLLLVIAGIIFCFMNFNSKKGINITTWNNYYNENNIIFFYDNVENERLSLLNSDYKVSEFVKDEKSEINKILKTVDIVNSLVESDDVPSKKINSGYDILAEKGETKKVSKKDMAIIERDLLASIGYDSRVGIFRKKNAQFTSNSEYYVVEYWSQEYSKWIMIDFLDRGYFLDGDEKLSAMEVLTSNISDISYLGKSSQKSYKNKIKSYLDSYTLALDNTISGNKSNCYLTYIKDKEALEIKFKDKFAPATIFTEEKKLFEKSPFDKQVGTDEKTYIIMSQISDKNSVTKNNKSSDSIKMVIGGFKDDKIMDSYYLNINDSGYESITKYKDIEIKPGINKIELSLDGTNPVSSVVIENNK